MTESAGATPADDFTGPDARPPGLDARLLELVDALRAHGVGVGTSELLDAFAALRVVSWADPHAFREALAATLAKSPEDRVTFDARFDAFLFREVEAQAIVRGESTAGAEREAVGVGGSDVGEDELAGRVDEDALRAAVAQAIRDGDEGAMRDLARLAIAAYASGAGGSGILGVDVQRIRRELGLRRPERALGTADDAADADADVARRSKPLPDDGVRRFERHLREALERARIASSGELPAARPLADLDRALPTGPIADLAAIHRVVAQLRRRLATDGAQSRGARRVGTVDIRATLHASLGFGGVPAQLRYKPRRPRRPELFVLCDVSTSVTSASVFFLSVLHALHDSFRKMRSFVFVERVSEVTEIFERERDFRGVSARIAGDAGVADVSGYTDYGRVWSELAGLVEGDLHGRSTLIVLGDARCNGRDPGVAGFATLAARAGKTLWLNPEPRLYWDYGDSVMRAYAPHCDAFECWTAAHLEAFVRRLAA